MNDNGDYDAIIVKNCDNNDNIGDDKNDKYHNQRDYPTSTT